MNDTRPPVTDSGEKATLTAFLGYLRDAVIAKVSGVPEPAVRTPGVASGTNLLGLVRHLTAAERIWFSHRFAGWDVDQEYGPVDLGMVVPDDETAGQVIAAYREETARSDEVIAGCDDLDRLCARQLPYGGTRSLRWVLIHMIEETGRHAGHADILREQFDGSTGR